MSIRCTKEEPDRDARHHPIEVKEMSWTDWAIRVTYRCPNCGLELGTVNQAAFTLAK